MHTAAALERVHARLDAAQAVLERRQGDAVNVAHGFQEAPHERVAVSRSHVVRRRRRDEVLA